MSVKLWKKRVKINWNSVADQAGQCLKYHYPVVGSLAVYAYGKMGLCFQSFTNPFRAGSTRTQINKNPGTILINLVYQSAVVNGFTIYCRNVVRESFTVQF